VTTTIIRRVEVKAEAELRDPVEAVLFGIVWRAVAFDPADIHTWERLSYLIDEVVFCMEADGAGPRSSWRWTVTPTLTEVHDAR
jgi:hypothetical protein